MATGRYVSYLRVSTNKQERSGAGLDAQRQAVTDYLNGGRWKLIAEYVETDSGRKRTRPQLAEAIRACRTYRATLVVAKLDRLARDVGFLSKLRDEQVDFVAADMPGANKFCLTVMMALAEQEAEMTADRTQKALATKRARGIKLGRPENLKPEHRAKAAGAAGAAHRERARERAEQLRPAIRAVKAEGAESLRQIAAALNARGVPTRREEGEWTATQVSRVLSYLREV